MRSIRVGVGLTAAVFLVTACEGGSEPEVEVAEGGNEGAAAAACAPDNGGLTLPAGFCAAVFHEGVGSARHLAVAENGDVYVAIGAQPGGAGGTENGVVALRDTDGDGRADETERFGAFHGTGIGIHNGYLYFASDTSVVRYPMPQGDALVPTEEPEAIVRGFPAQRTHAAKPLAFDDEGNLFVTVGAPSNACGGETDRQPGAVGQDPCPEYERQAAVWRFDADTPGQEQLEGDRYAYGIRNAVALAYSPADDGVWVVQHGRDQLNTISEDFTPEDNATRPAEELLRLEEGTAYSWPYCFYDLETNRHLLNPEYGGSGEEVGQCADFPDPVAVYGGHWAPNDLLFYTGDQFPDEYSNGAFIAFHGSWNRGPLPQEGYNVVFQPLNGDTSGGEYQVFADGFAGMESLPSPGEAEHRPVGLAQGPDGSLFISDSMQGTIWKVMYTGE